MIVASLIVGAIGSALFIASCASTNRKHILVLGLLASAALVVSYALKGDGAASMLVVIAFARNFLYLAAGDSAIRRRVVWAAVSIAAAAAWALATDWSTFQWWTPMPVVGALIMAAALAQSNLVRLKSLQIVNGALWLGYEWMSGAYSVMIGESLGLILAGVALWRLLRPRVTDVSPHLERT